MSKTITIPASAGNRVTIILNGRSYELPTGVEISVPDEVAALLANNETLTPETRQVAAGEIPPITAADKGKVLSTDDETGELKWTEGGGGSGGGALVVNPDAQTGALDKTWQEIADAKYAVLAFEVGSKTNICPLLWFQRDGGNYKVAFAQFVPMLSEPEQFEVWLMLFATNSADGYPVAAED